MSARRTQRGGKRTKASLKKQAAHNRRKAEEAEVSAAANNLNKVGNVFNAKNNNTVEGTMSNNREVAEAVLKPRNKGEGENGQGIPNRKPNNKPNNNSPFAGVSTNVLAKNNSNKQNLMSENEYNTNSVKEIENSEIPPGWHKWSFKNKNGVENTYYESPNGTTTYNHPSVAAGTNANVLSPWKKYSYRNKNNVAQEYYYNPNTDESSWNKPTKNDPNVNVIVNNHNAKPPAKAANNAAKEANKAANAAANAVAAANKAVNAANNAATNANIAKANNKVNTAAAAVEKANNAFGPVMTQLNKVQNALENLSKAVSAPAAGGARRNRKTRRANRKSRRCWSRRN